jgi:hypothetical protein
MQGPDELDYWHEHWSEFYTVANGIMEANHGQDLI